MNPETVKHIERKIREIARDYESKGFEVLVNPSPSRVPKFLHGFSPDIIAKGENESIIIEVKVKSDNSQMEDYKEIAEKINERKNWRFEIVFINPYESRIVSEELNDLNTIKERIHKIEDLQVADQFDAAFLLAWATLEAVIRYKLKDEKNDSFNKPTLTAIKTLYSLGLVNQSDYRRLEALNSARNILVHGYRQEITKKMVLDVISLITYFLGESDEAQLYNWLEDLDLEYYEDIYCLYRTVSEVENHGIFSIKRQNDTILLQAYDIDSTLRLENETQRLLLLDLIEKEYMDDMSPEGWYAFHRAMEKDD